MTSHSSTKPRVIVIGGSLGGLSAGLWLQDIGCEVDIYERTPVLLEDRGAGLVLNPATIRYFTTHGVLELDQISASARWVRYMNRDGSIADEEPCRYRFTAYNALYRGLLRTFPERRYHLGAECVGFRQDRDGVTVQFADGSEQRCDLLVCADGINSIGRRILLPEVQPQYSGYVAWRGTVSEDALPSDVFNALHEAFTYALMPDSHALSYPIPDAEGRVHVGRRLTNWLWYRNVAAGADLEDLLTGRDGQRFGGSLPPGAAREEFLDELRSDASALPPAFSTLINQTASPFLQVIFDVEVPKMAFDRVCLIGDAAFVARPHAAAGTAKAAQDAWALAEAVRRADGDVVEALRAWEPEQLALGQQVVDRARNAGERLQQGRWQPGDPLPFGLTAPGDSVIA